MASLTLVSAYDWRFSRPKMPCSRDTVNPPAPITTSMTSGIHSRLRTLKIANPPHPFRYPAPSQPLDSCSTVTSCDAAPRERDPILTSKPCRCPPYRLFPTRYGIVMHTTCVKGGTAAGVQPHITWRALCWAVMQLTFQRARACRVAKRHKARPIAASSTRSHHHRNPAPRTTSELCRRSHQALGQTLGNLCQHHRTFAKRRTDPVGLQYRSERFHSRLDGLENW